MGSPTKRNLRKNEGVKELKKNESNNTESLLPVFENGQAVWVKMSGYPWWPAIINNDCLMQINDKKRFDKGGLLCAEFIPLKQYELVRNRKLLKHFEISMKEKFIAAGNALIHSNHEYYVWFQDALNQIMEYTSKKKSEKNEHNTILSDLMDYEMCDASPVKELLSPCEDYLYLSNRSPPERYSVKSSPLNNASKNAHHNHMSPKRSRFHQNYTNPSEKSPEDSFISGKMARSERTILNQSDSNNSSSNFRTSCSKDIIVINSSKKITSTPEGPSKSVTNMERHSNCHDSSEFSSELFFKP